LLPNTRTNAWSLSLSDEQSSRPKQGSFLFMRHNLNLNRKLEISTAPTKQSLWNQLIHTAGAYQKQSRLAEVKI